MDKTTSFPGQPVLGQILALIPRQMVESLAKKHGTDRYYKTFRSYDHVVTMLFAVFSGCTSLREVITGMMANGSRLLHLGIRHTPRRSTLAEANAKRDACFFESLFHSLLRLYSQKLSPDSRKDWDILKRLYVVDSTTITLFSDVMRGTGLSKADGRKKGGAKAHMLLNAHQDLPTLVRITEGIRSDRVFIADMELPGGSIVVMDKAYNYYQQFNKWHKKGVVWVTRMLSNAAVEVISQNLVVEEMASQGVLSDELVVLGSTSKIKVQARLIRYRHVDPVSKAEKDFEFITNSLDLEPMTICNIYRNRWQIEILFKRIKQAYPLKYFLGDNPNAIKIQIWCALIADLLTMVIMQQAKAFGKRWSYANLAGLIRIHLATYVDLYKFLMNPEKSLRTKGPPGVSTPQLTLF